MGATQARPEVHVMAGVLSDDQGRVLIAQRPVGKHLAGRWEFPGGKLARNEAPLAGLKREIEEELGVSVLAAEPLIRLRHDYSDRRVLLDVWTVSDYAGEPRGLDAQAIEWVAPDDLPSIDLLEADRPIITALRLPRIARCIAGAKALLESTAGTRPEALFWSLQDAEAGSEAIREAVRAARRAGHRVIVKGEGVEAAMAAAAAGADGMLLEPTGGMLTIDPNGSFMVGAICPTVAAAEYAAAAGAHFLVLAPGAEGTDQRQFNKLLGQLGLPAYLGWYRDADALKRMLAGGAHGCAIGPAADDAG